MSQLNAAFMSNDSTYEVQRTNNFRFVVSLDEFTNNSTMSSGDIIELACDSAGLPTTSNDAIELDYGNSNVKVAGKSTTDDISVAVKDFIEPDVENILWQWRMKVYNPETGKVGWAVNYKKDCMIVQYGPNGEVLRKWKCEGCWPTTLDLGDMDYSSGDKKQITMTLSVDTAYLIRDGAVNTHIYDTK
jgi:hypothetical protein|nr:MAG TPA: Baseplate wedge protein [Bacteriophage sp.]